MTKDTRAIIVAIVMATIAIIGINKTDIAELRTELKTDIAELRTELKADIAELRTELKADITELRGLLFSHTAGHSHPPKTAAGDEEARR